MSKKPEKPVDNAIESIEGGEFSIVTADNILTPEVIEQISNTIADAVIARIEEYLPKKKVEIENEIGKTTVYKSSLADHVIKADGVVIRFKNHFYRTNLTKEMRILDLNPMVIKVEVIK